MTGRAETDAMHADPKRSPNLYFVGFMGTGKTLIGRRVAKALGMQFVDADHAIEMVANKSIPEIFAAEGEAGFRAMERRFMESGHADSGCVVSCGGGLVTGEGMIELLREKGIVFVLFASAETILRRTSSNQNRPLLRAPDPEARIRVLLAEREPLYLRAGIGFSTENRSADDIVRHCVRTYRYEVQRRQRASGAGTAPG